MKILDMINSPWAIDPPFLNEIVSTYRTFMKQDKIDFKALLAAQTQQSSSFVIVNRAAVIPVKGPITKGDGFFSFFFSGASTQIVKAQINEALESPDVDKIILDIDSPGGTVDGSFELADFVFEAKKQKPIEAFSDGSMTSAAYLIAASTDRIAITGKTNRIGSIGVIATHIDYSAQNEQYGEVVTEVVSGEFKNIFSPDKPLSELGLKTLQDQVNYTFSIFAQDVAERRTMTVESIVEMQAAVFIGQQSIDVGLVDVVSTLGQLTSSVGETIFEVNKMSEEKTVLTIEQIKTEQPSLYQDIVGIGAQDERARILNIQGAAFPGQDELTKRLIDDSSISAGDAALQFNAAEKTVQKTKEKEIVDELKDNPVEIVGNAEEPEIKDTTKKGWMALVKEHRKENGCTLKEAMAICSTKFEAEHKQFLKRGE